MHWVFRALRCAQLLHFAWKCMSSRNAILSYVAGSYLLYALQFSVKDKEKLQDLFTPTHMRYHMHYMRMKQFKSSLGFVRACLHVCWLSEVDRSSCSIWHALRRYLTSLLPILTRKSPHHRLLWADSVAVQWYSRLGLKQVMRRPNNV